MSWLDVFTPSKEIRPARPADEKLAGRKIDQGTVGTSSTSSTSSNKTCNVNVDEVPPTITTADTPTPEQLAHARRLVVDCPIQGRGLHCWHCSRCGDTRTCSAWRGLRSEVERLKHSGKPYSLTLVEEMEAAHGEACKIQGGIRNDEV